MIKKKLVIFPFNGNGIEALDCMDCGKYEFVGFIDDDQQKSSDQYPVFNREVLRKYKDLYILAVPGGPKSFRERKHIIDSLPVSSDRFISVIHPSASLGRNVQMGINCLIMAGVVLTSNSKLGKHVCVLPNTVIHHDSHVGDYTMLGSNVAIAGGTTIGKNCYIGSGTNIINGIEVGDNSLVGLGSNILKNVEKESIMVGNPGRDLNMSKRKELI